MLIEKYGEDAVRRTETMILQKVLHDLEKACVREMILEEHKRPDGRKIR